MLSRKLRIVSAAAAIALSSSACGGAGNASGNASFPADPLLELQSDSGQQRVTVRTAPEQPPTRGIIDAQLTITDAATGDPQIGLDLKVIPWMPAMGHGTSVEPTVVETAAGVYDLQNLVLFMPGTWEIRTQWAGSVVENVTPTFDVR